MRLTWAEAEAAAASRLVEAGASEGVARSVAAALVGNEAEGNPICGLYYLPVFVEQLRSGRLDGRVEPAVEEDGTAIRVDARCGFAQPALDAGLPGLVRVARTYGVAALAVRRSYNALALGDPVRRLAEEGLFALAFANAPASVAPPGAARPLFGTNPLAFAAPLPGDDPLVIDQSTSAVAKTEVLMRAENGQTLEPGWAQDARGRPTTDARAALAGALLPAGGTKGANVALIVEMMAAALTGGTPSAEAPPLGDATAPHPALGQTVIALDPARLGAAGAERIAALVSDDPALRLPGSRRAAARRHAAEEGIEVPGELAAAIRPT